MIPSTSGTRLDAVVRARDYMLANEKRGKVPAADATYRSLMQHRHEKGDYHAAGEFYFREMECIRKQRSGLRRFLWTMFYKSSCGYDERPVWTFAWAFGDRTVGLGRVSVSWYSQPRRFYHALFFAPAFHVFMDGLSLS